MSILAANKSGLKFEKIIKIVHKLKPVEGRLEKIGKIKNNSKVILDYAHTPDALKNVLETINDIRSDNEKLITENCLYNLSSLYLIYIYNII